MNCVLQDLKQNFLRGYSVIDLRIEKNSGKQLFTKLYELWHYYWDHSFKQLPYQTWLYDPIKADFHWSYSYPIGIYFILECFVFLFAQKSLLTLV